LSLVCSLVVGQSKPTFSKEWSANFTKIVVISPNGNQTVSRGSMYFSERYQSNREGGTENGIQVETLNSYPLRKKFDIVGDACTLTSLTGDYADILDGISYCNYQGQVTINGQQTNLWGIDIAKFVLQYYVSIATPVVPIKVVAIDGTFVTGSVIDFEKWEPQVDPNIFVPPSICRSDDIKRSSSLIMSRVLSFFNKFVGTIEKKMCCKNK